MITYGEPGERIVAQGVQYLGAGCRRYWNRWDTGVETWEDYRATHFVDARGESVSSNMACGSGRGRVPRHVLMVSTADLKAAMGPNWSP